MPGTTTTHFDVDITLKGVRSKRKIEPYNKFSLQYTVTETLTALRETKRKEGDRTLAEPKALGLNPAWLHTRRAPVDQAVNEAHKMRIRSLHTPNFPYWGHLIHKSIQQFNASSPNRCRKLVYDLRHGEADHNAWKKLLIERNQVEKWTKDPEYKRQPIIKWQGNKYCIIDPPLTATGVDQAQKTRRRFIQLKQHMFPMPKRAYISPLLRAMQTFEHALGDPPQRPGERPGEGPPIIVQPEDSYILNDLREKETGNCADILIDEYISHSKKPPKAGTNAEDKSWMENDGAVQERAASVHDDIFGMDESDCIVRVTHSLLIQNNLTGLEVGGRKVLQKFMLAEGGLFAYVIEGEKTNKTEKTAKEWRDYNFKTVEKRKKRICDRRESAFQDLKAATKLFAVTIERPILAM